MASDKKKQPRFVAKGIAELLFLLKPSTKFKAEGAYAVKLRMSADEAAPHMARIEAAAQNAVAECQANWKAQGKKGKVKVGDLPFVQDEDTGDVVFSFKRNASGIDPKTKEPWTAHIPVFGKNGKPFASNEIPGNGSTVAISYSLKEYPATGTVGAGVKLNIMAAQIIDLVPYTGGNAESYGFDVEEDDAEEVLKDDSETDAAESEDDGSGDF
jgi:hypothetical protein